MTIANLKSIQPKAKFTFDVSGVRGKITRVENEIVYFKKTSPAMPKNECFRTLGHFASIASIDGGN